MNVRSQDFCIQKLYVGFRDRFRVGTPVRTAAPRKKNLPNRFSDFFRLFPTFPHFFRPFLMKMLGKLENFLNFRNILVISNVYRHMLWNFTAVGLGLRVPGCRQGTILAPVTARPFCPAAALGHFGSKTRPQGRAEISDATEAKSGSLSSGRGDTCSA